MITAYLLERPTLGELVKLLNTVASHANARDYVLKLENVTFDLTRIGCGAPLTIELDSENWIVEIK